MKSPICILHLEDDPNDAALVAAVLESGGIRCVITRVQDRDEFVAALERGGVDLILSDFSLPDFDGLSALSIVRANYRSIPLILVSGTLGEDLAIDSFKNGATDYVLKERMTRLVPAVRRAMEEVQDRAANRQTQMELQEIEQRLEIVFTESPMGIALVGVDGHPVLTNPALQEMLGYTGDELSRMHFKEFTHPEDCAKDMALYEELIQGKRDGYQMEKRYIRKDEKLVWARLTVSLARRRTGPTHFVIGMVEDITENRHLQSQFIEAQKMEVIGHLASGVAHDFNNILAVIMGYSDLLTMKLPKEGEELKGFVETIRSAAERAAGLTRQLLVFSRKQTVQPVVLDLNVMVQDLDKMLRRLIDENIEMTIIPGKQLGHVKADSGYIGQLLMNLAINARDAMPNGGRLTIATENITVDENFAREHASAITGECVMFSVSDTGTGMTEEVKARLFEAFFTTKPKGKGTGLGLATCQTIVQQSGGYIEVFSEIDRGTIFKIYFPRVHQPLDAGTQFLRRGPLPRGSETLLVVEDEPSVRHLAKSALEAQGYTVLSASNGQDALNRMRDHCGSPVQLVISDLIMPIMGGKTMGEWLKTSNPEIKILFTSGYSGDDIVDGQGLPPGVEFLPKPYMPGALACKVREMLDAPQMKSTSELP